MRHGKVEDVPVYLMDKVKTKAGFAAIQSLTTGQTAIIKTTKIKNITTDYDKVSE